MINQSHSQRSQFASISPNTTRRLPLKSRVPDSLDIAGWLPFFHDVRESRIDHVGGQGLQNRLLAKIECQRSHVAEEQTLPMTNLGQGAGEFYAVPMKTGPVGPLMDK